MAAGKLNLTIEQGATLRKQLTWKTGTPSLPVNLTGYAARMMLKTSTVRNASKIIAITKANPAVVTTQEPHKLTTGKSVILTDVGGMTQINNVRAQVTYITPTTFSLAIDSTAFTTYTSGGAAAFVSLTNVSGADGQLILGGGAGTIVIFIRDGITDVLSGGGAYDLEMISPALDVIRLVEGAFVSMPNVTTGAP